MIETTLDIPLRYPRRRRFLAQYRVALLHSVCRASLRSEPVGVLVRQTFCDWFQCEQVKRLHRWVFHRWQHHSTLPPFPSHLWIG
jgi:hypothetical protein